MPAPKMPPRDEDVLTEDDWRHPLRPAERSMARGLHYRPGDYQSGATNVQDALIEAVAEEGTSRVLHHWVEGVEDAGAYSRVFDMELDGTIQKFRVRIPLMTTGAATFELYLNGSSIATVTMVGGETNGSTLLANTPFHINDRLKLKFTTPAYLATADDPFHAYIHVTLIDDAESGLAHSGP